MPPTETDGIGHYTAKDCVFRIYRDVRFSKDKSPYKTHFGAHVTAAAKKSEIHTKAGCNLHLEPGGESFLAVGAYLPESQINGLKRFGKRLHTIPLSSIPFSINIVSNSNKLYWKISATFLLVMVVLGGVYVLVSAYTYRNYTLETSQKLHAHLADHIVKETKPLVNGKPETSATHDKLCLGSFEAKKGCV